jgi:hypothetical protein
MGSGVRVCQVFGSGQQYVVMAGEKEVESFDDLVEAGHMAYEFIKTMSALKGRSQK